VPGCRKDWRRCAVPLGGQAERAGRRLDRVVGAVGEQQSAVEEVERLVEAVVAVGTGPRKRAGTVISKTAKPASSAITRIDSPA
jgi:hypothetical protein